VNKLFSTELPQHHDEEDDGEQVRHLTRSQLIFGLFATLQITTEVCVCVCVCARARVCVCDYMCA